MDIEVVIGKLNKFAKQEGVEAAVAKLGDSSTHAIMTYQHRASHDIVEAMKISGFISVAESEGVKLVSINYLRSYHIGEAHQVCSKLSEIHDLNVTGNYSMLNKYAILIEVDGTLEDSESSESLDRFSTVLAEANLPLAVVLVYDDHIARIHASSIDECMQENEVKKADESTGIPESKEEIAQGVEDFLNSI
jgi:hypothetical protein